MGVRGSPVLITGVTGFIGSHLALEVADRGYPVVGLHRGRTTSGGPLPALTAHERIKLREADLHNTADLHGHVRDAAPSVICHLGALTMVSRSFGDAQTFNSVNTTGTLGLAEAAREHAPDLQKFLFASSMEIYGNQPGATEPFDDDPPVYTEDMTPRPSAPYGASKRAAELYLETLHESFGFPHVSLRQTNCYGRRYNTHFVTEAFVTAMLESDDAVNFGDPRPWRNFIHVDDVVRLYLHLIESDTSGMHGEAYNIGPPNAIQIRDLAHRIAELTGFDGDINWHTREHRPGEIWCLNSSHAKLEAATGWAPDISLDDGLERVVEYWSA